MSELIVRAPGAGLDRFVDHYWLSASNTDDEVLVVPDGRVDLVIDIGRSGCALRVHGSTTRPQRQACTPGHHYLGIRLRPGQSRHFLRASAAELTDAVEDASHLLCTDLRPLADGQRNAPPDARVFARIDRLLADALRQSRTDRHHADTMVEQIEASHGAIRFRTLCERIGRSPRWLERVFLQTVGVTPKFFSQLTRARHAAGILDSSPAASLAEAAHDAGYADQSHMTREFVRIFGTTPARRRAAGRR